jgi:hypothetical protein
MTQQQHSETVAAEEQFLEERKVGALAKLMQARKEFHKRALKKSGHNKFSDFKYLELGDFLLPAMDIFDSLKLGALTSFTRELATMTITDLEDGTEVVITSPFGSAALKACHEVQNIGAVETYQRRYLWVAALEIVEHDALDASVGDTKSGEVKPQSTPSAQKKIDIDAVDEATRLTILGFERRWREAFKFDKAEAYRIFCEGRDEMVSDATAQSALQGLVTKEEASAFAEIRKQAKQSKEVK